MIWYDLRNKKQGQIAEINITVGANAKLMTYNNFTQYRFGLPYRYFGGTVIKSPCQISIPFDESWILVLDSWFPFRASNSVKIVDAIADDADVELQVDVKEQAETESKLKLDLKPLDTRDNQDTREDSEIADEANTKVKEAEEARTVNNAKQIEIWTEGKTDAILIKKAAEKLNIKDAKDWLIKRVNLGKNIVSDGVDNLITALQVLIDNDNITQKIVIGVFDRDLSEKQNLKLQARDGTNQDLLKNDYIRLSDNIFAFALPVPHNRKQINEISIEHYFTDNEIKTPHNGLRLFLHDEFCSETGVSLDKAMHCKTIISKKEKIKILSHDEKTQVTDLHSKENYLLSKGIFADLISADTENFATFNFSEFQKIFDVITKILETSKL